MSPNGQLRLGRTVIRRFWGQECRLIDWSGRRNAPEKRIHSDYFPHGIPSRAAARDGLGAVMGALEEAIQIPYVETMVEELTIRGNFMYPPAAIGDIGRMIASKLIDLDLIDVQSYPMVEAADAIENASKKRGFSFNVLLNED